MRCLFVECLFLRDDGELQNFSQVIPSGNLELRG